MSCRESTIELPQDVDGADRGDRHSVVRDGQWPDRCKASSTDRNSRQLMCKGSRGPFQNPEAACPLHVCPLHVAHQPALEASIMDPTGNLQLESKLTQKYSI